MDLSGRRSRARRCWAVITGAVAWLIGGRRSRRSRLWLSRGMGSASTAARDQSPTAAVQIAAFVRLGRPKFLFQSLLVVGLGAALAGPAGPGFRLDRYLLALAFAWVMHLMTHYCNEYFDLEADRANPAPTAWTGGSRVLVAGLLPPVVSLGASFVLLFVLVFLTAAMPDPASRVMAATMATVAWFYTAPPLRLNYRGLGELSCAGVLYGLLPLLACYLQSNSVHALGLAVAGVVCVFQFLRMAIMNLADIDGDRQVGKHTLAVIMGTRGVVRLYVGGQLVAYAAIVVLAVAEVVPLAVAVAMTVPALIPVWVSRRLLDGSLADSRRSNAVTFWSSMHLPATSTATTIGLLAVGGGQQPPVLAWVVLLAAITAFALWFARELRRSARHGMRCSYDGIGGAAR